MREVARIGDATELKNREDEVVLATEFVKIEDICAIVDRLKTIRLFHIDAQQIREEDTYVERKNESRMKKNPGSSEPMEGMHGRDSGPISVEGKRLR